MLWKHYSQQKLCNRGVYLFTDYANHAEEKFITNPDNEKFDEMLNKIRNNKVSKTNLHKLLKAIVEFEFSGIQKDCCDFQTL